MIVRMSSRFRVNGGARRKKGFSLVEVMFALFLVALVIGIASKVAGNSVRNTTSLKESTFARWVALNQIDLYKIELAQGKAVPSVGNNAVGESEMGNMEWRWEREVRASSSADLLEIRVDVFRTDNGNDDEAVITMKGYVAAE